MSSEPLIWDRETAEVYDDHSAPMYDPAVLGPTVEFLAALAGTGPVLEFAIGTGRVALPLVERGIPVRGIELSPAMVAELRRKADEETVPVAIGDMATADAPRPELHTLVFLVFNGISNLTTQAAQVACFRNAARHLAPGGRFVIELVVPALRSLPPGQDAVVVHSEPGYMVVDTFDVVAQQLTSHHFRFGGERHASLFRSTHRYAFPAELDLMAELAGLTLEARYADFAGTSFAEGSAAHVSVYRRPDEGTAIRDTSVFVP